MVYYRGIDSRGGYFLKTVPGKVPWWWRRALHAFVPTAPTNFLHEKFCIFNMEYFYSLEFSAEQKRSLVLLVNNKNVPIS